MHPLLKKKNKITISIFYTGGHYMVLIKEIFLNEERNVELNELNKYQKEISSKEEEKEKSNFRNLSSE